MAAAWNDLPAAGGLPECAPLVDLAERLEWTAPELVVPYARRALGAGGGSGAVAVRARSLLADALVRLGRHADAVEPALDALRAAHPAGVPDLAVTNRLVLAACSRGLGEPLLGCGILRPVLEAAGTRPAVRARAIGQLVGCTAHVGRRDDLEDALAEADRLLAADDGLSADERRMERALLCARTAAYHRRYGETEDAVAAARDGLGMLNRLRDARLEGGQAAAWLILELVCALLDDGGLAEAEQAAEPVLAQPVRATAAPAVGRLLLAMATRVHLPAGRVELGRAMLDQAVGIAERHLLDWLLADALTATAHLDERAAKPTDALRALRSAHAAEHRQLHAGGLAKRRLMIEFGLGDHTQDAVNSLLRTVVRQPAGGPAAPPPAAEPATPVSIPAELIAETDAATGLLSREGLSQRVQAVRGGNRPIALTLVRLGHADAGAGQDGTSEHRHDHGTESGGPWSDDDADADGAPEALTALAGRVRDIAPDDAELARSDGSELAVLLPHTTRDEAEELATAIRESAIESDWLADADGPEVSISTGVAQSGLDPAVDTDADTLLTAARETLTTADRDRTNGTGPARADSGERWPADERGPDERVGGLAGDLFASLLVPPSLTGPPLRLEYTVPREPGPGEEVPQPPDSPDIVTPDEPDQVPPARPQPDPTHEPPEPPKKPKKPGEPEHPKPPEPIPPPASRGLPEPGSPARDDHPLDVILGPVQGPEPRPPDLPPRTDRATQRRRERSDTTSIADLLAEALVAYQETTPEPAPPAMTDEPEYPPPRPRDDPAPEQRIDSGVAGRHRMPDWASSDMGEAVAKRPSRTQGDY